MTNKTLVLYYAICAYEDNGIARFCYNNLDWYGSKNTIANNIKILEYDGNKCMLNKYNYNDGNICCIDCNNCNECSFCINCKDCDNCCRCIHLSDSKFCNYSNELINCNFCNYCDNCTDCTFNNKCSKCINCSYCDLINNSIKYTKKGKIELNASYVKSMFMCRLKITIKDTGVATFEMGCTLS